MLKSVQWIMERIAERIVPVVAASFASVIEGVLAVGRAEQQSRLEDAARQYEEEGKAEIAAALRRQLSRMSSSNPAGQALEIQEHLAGDGDQARIGQADATADDADLARLPDFSSGASKSRRKKNRGGNDNSQDL